MRALLLLVLMAEPVTGKNWQHHPKIEEVRAIVAEVDAAKLKTRKAECQFESRTLYLDPKGLVRRYTWEFGGEDSSNTVDFYYDEQGRLRFALCSSGAVPSAHRSTRIWYGED